VEVMSGGVLASDGKRRSGKIDGSKAGLRQICRERQRDGSGSGTYVEDIDLTIVRNASRLVSKLSASRSPMR